MKIILSLVASIGVVAFAPKAPDYLPEISVIVSEQTGCNPNTILPMDRLRGDLGATTLDLVEIIIAVETKYHIHITDDEAIRARTIGELVALVEVKLRAKKRG